VGQDEVLWLVRHDQAAAKKTPGHTKDRAKFFIFG
jgi:hypothetical protein